MAKMTLGTVAQYINGRAFKPEEWEEEGMPIIRIQNLTNSSDVCNRTRNIYEDKYLVKDGDLLFAWSASLGAHIWHGENAWLNQHIFKVIPNDNIDKHYLYFYLLHVVDQLYAKTHGSGMVHITQKPFKDTPIIVPSLRVQQHIVDRIESLFTRLDEAKEKAQAVVNGFEDRKAAILHKAFTGELTRKWRGESDISSKSWVKYTYDQLGSSKLGKMLDREKNTGRAIPYLRNVNVRWFDFDLSDVSTMLASDEEIVSLRVREGDLFICEGGEPGRCAIWHGENTEMIFQKALHRFRHNDKVKSEYLCYYLFYLHLIGSLEKYFTGTTIKHLTGKSLAEIQIILPPIHEQEKIISLLNSILSFEQQAKESAELFIAQIDAIKKSILARAFRGELGTHDPADESAETLLKRIL